MPRIGLVSVFLCLGLAIQLGAGSALAQTAHGLTEAERSEALKAEASAFSTSKASPGVTESSAVAGLAVTTKGASGKTVIISAVPVGSASTNTRHESLAKGAAVPVRRALVTRYEYATGLTIRTWVDLASNKALAVRSDANYPTPLAPEELQEAKALARASDAEFDKIVSEGGGDVKFHHLVPVSNSSSSPRYGHRLVWLWTVAPVVSEKYVIDLTWGGVG